MSLIAPSDPSPHGPALPPGHPFTNIQFSFVDAYWSATTLAENANLAWLFTFRPGVGLGVVPYNDKNVRANVWCVRGGYHSHQY